MQNLSYKGIREKYIEYFKNNKHKEIPNSSLIPENDPSVLFVNAGMFPLVPFLNGEKHPLGNRLTNSQRCLRTGDIDEVGDNFHCTTFEMLGNWSLNDYFKKEAINYTVDFFVKELKLDINKIYTSVFGGEGTIPEDSESISIWKNIFSKYSAKGKRIFKYGKDKNWWGLEKGGPCGPDSEIFYDTGKEKCSPSCNPNCECGKYVEIGNNVFMEYLKTDKDIKSLGRHNVDFGGGLERLTAIIQNVSSVYETDIYKPIFLKICQISNKDNFESQRIIADHIKASVLIIMDGIKPGRNGQEYILRRLIRRAVRHGRKLEIKESFTKEIGEICISQFTQIYPQLSEKKDIILNTLDEEEKKFRKTLENGLKELDKMLSREEIDGGKAFILYETYGLPIELTEEILEEKGRKLVKHDLFERAEMEHKNKSRGAAKGLFKGGLADTSEMSTKYHTTTHLLLQALREVLGNHVYQKGCNITPERIRFDFPSEEKLTDEQIKKIENIVNEQIDKALPVTFEEFPKEQALKLVQFAAFSERYGDIVKVYYIGPKDNPYSIEICNGPHVKNTKELGKFKITKQESIGSGIKRIKAILI
ncbi:MAG: alanine--tRNA ligase [Candidatus Dojkabacteria bacterium]|nr:alanine--tRNA ligase [Candidatus Dojkabacteria bacterium]